ncbi:uncharacterized protein LOC143085550 isoform X2 [Mytilus galloprovincialis]|uniref:uncharacterized protein LOC143085550 isoform X2 n=1 Tax=Mytilus galloprovincialis TaxID=29158 RepID=UPI003F7B9518
MSFFRLSPHRKSNKKRKYEVVSPQGLDVSPHDIEEEHKELKYDDVKNSITGLENDLNKLRKKLKLTLKARDRDNSFVAAKQHVLDTVHGHIYSLNEGFGIRFPELIRLENEIRQKEEEFRIVKKEKIELERKVREFNSAKIEYANSLQEKENELQVCREKTKEREKELQKQLNEQDAGFAEQLKGKERIIEGQKITITRLEDQIKTKDNDIERLKDTNEREKQLIVDHYQETIQNKEKEIHRLNNNLQHVNHQVQQYAEQKEEEMKRMQVDLQRKENTVQQLLKQRDEEKAAKEDERKQKDEALTRLSAIAGDRLRNNNPGITDLSDPNRPMKIAEKFTEMYDNDWTDSMEALEDLGLNEEECVIMLLHFLTDSYEECGKLVAELDRHIEQAVTLTHCEQDGDKSGESSSSSQNIPPEILKPIKDIRRKMTVNNMEILQKKLLDHLKIVRMDVKDDHISACSKFVADCIKYAWMMQIQDPPVYIEWDFPSDTKIDTNILRSYTKAGDQVDFIVWPVLYLHKDGPVLNKGVVQPKSK